MAADKTPPKKEEQDQPKTVVVRILVDTRVGDSKYRCDDPVELPADTAAALVKSGEADAHEDAVAYATTVLGRQIIKHQ